MSVMGLPLSVTAPVLSAAIFSSFLFPVLLLPLSTTKAIGILATPLRIANWKARLLYYRQNLKDKKEARGRGGV
jgi:hypothetical protein